MRRKGGKEKSGRGETVREGVKVLGREGETRGEIGGEDTRGETDSAGYS